MDRLAAVASLIVIASMRAIGFVPQPPMDSKLPMYGYQVQHVYPHDPNAFTQGLQIRSPRWPRSTTQWTPETA